MKKALVLAALLLLPGDAALAKTGILVCQMSVSQFATDAARMAGQLSAAQLAAARQLVDVGRSQCRSSSDVVDANISSTRSALGIAVGPQAAERFDEFWPASREELSALTK